MGFHRDHGERDQTPNDAERATMTAWRFGFITRETAVASLGEDRFNALLTPREKAAIKASKP